MAFPTETVYGLGADATNGRAVAQIYSVKSRPQINPLIVHVAQAEIAQRYVEWNALAEKLATKFWPGPLTLILPRRADCLLSDLVSAGGNTVGIRIPSHPIARQLLAAFDGPIAAPSANRSGRVSPTTAQHVQDELGNVVPLIIDGGACHVGVESTVLDLSDDTPILLRPGSITRAMIEELLDRPLMKPHKTSDILRAPGQLESHYAPNIAVRLNAYDVAADEALLAFGPNPLRGAAITRNLSAAGDLSEAAANLFAALRALDQPHYRAIAVMPIPNEGVGEAINDRLARAAVR